MTAQPIRHADELARRHRGHFFDTATMRAFGSRIGPTVYPAAGGARSYFVTSERDYYGSAWDSARRYTVRVITWATGSVDEPDADAFGAFRTLRSAEARARTAARDDTEGVAPWPCPIRTHRDYGQGIGLRARVYCGACLDDGAALVRAESRARVSTSRSLAALR